MWGWLASSRKHPFSLFITPQILRGHLGKKHLPPAQSYNSTNLKRETLPS